MWGPGDCMVSPSAAVGRRRGRASWRGRGGWSGPWSWWICRSCLHDNANCRSSGGCCDSQRHRIACNPLWRGSPMQPRPRGVRQAAAKLLGIGYAFRFPRTHGVRRDFSRYSLPLPAHTRGATRFAPSNVRERYRLPLPAHTRGATARAQVPISSPLTTGFRERAGRCLPASRLRARVGE